MKHCLFHNMFMFLILYLTHQMLSIIKHKVVLNKYAINSSISDRTLTSNKLAL